MLNDRVYGVKHAVPRAVLSAPPGHRATSFAVSMTVSPSRANYLVVRTKTGALSEIYNAGRFMDRLVDDDGALRFSEKLCVFDSDCSQIR